MLAAVDPADLSGEQRVDLIKAWERVASWVSARQHVALASVVESTEELGLAGHLARHEVGAALRLAPGTAYDRCRRARELTGRLADTLSVLAAGEINLGQAWALTDAVEYLDDDVTVAVQTRVLARAPRQTAAQTRQSLRRAVLALDPAGAAERAAAARAARLVDKRPLDDGMTEIRAVVSATDGERIWCELSSLAKARGRSLRGAGELDPGIDALRADALVEAVLAATPQAGARASVQVNVTIDAATLLGLAEQPAQLAGYGPIPAQLARDLAADGEWVRWTTDPQTGHLLDLNPHVYRPSDKLARFVRAAHPRCGWLGCRQPCARCDLDHVIEHPTGPTVRSNLGPLCRQHHNAKTHGRWQYRRDPDGTGHLRSPLGHTYDVAPRDCP